jgi:hypothetical protein
VIVFVLCCVVLIMADYIQRSWSGAGDVRDGQVGTVCGYRGDCRRSIGEDAVYGIWGSDILICAEPFVILGYQEAKVDLGSSLPIIVCFDVACLVCMTPRWRRHLLCPSGISALKKFPLLHMNVRGSISNIRNFRSVEDHFQGLVEVFRQKIATFLG